MGAFTYTAARLSIAHHEAGHAVMAMASGLHVVSSEISVDGDVTASGGWNVGGITYILMLPHLPMAWGKQAAAGELAGLKWHHQTGLTSAKHIEAASADHDFREATDTLSPYGFDLPAAWPALRETARHAVDVLWAEITAVATALDQAGRLTGAEVAQVAGLINAPGPDVSPVDSAR